jgi:hypothetical protein
MPETKTKPTSSSIEEYLASGGVGRPGSVATVTVTSAHIVNRPA